MKKYSVVIIVIIAIIIVFFLTSFRKEKEIDFNKVIREVNQERKTILESESKNDIEQYIYKVAGDKEGFTDEEIETLLQPRTITEKRISKEDTLEDVDYLFRVLKYVYGGYGYYGGDEVFEQIKTKVINRINTQDDVSIIDLNTIFFEHLSFIKDGHMKIGGAPVNKKHILNYYCNQQIEVKKNNKGFYYIVDDKKRYLKAINNNEVERYLKLSINESGELVYYIGLLQNDKTAKVSLTVEYKLDFEIKKNEIKLSKVSQKGHKNQTAFKQKTIQGIPVLICRDLDDKQEENTLKYFSESGLKLKEESVFIIDLRGNGGGSDVWCNFWFENYTDAPPQTGKSSMKRYSKLYLYGQKKEQEIAIEPFLNKYDMPRLNEVVKSYYESRYEALSNKAYDTWEVKKDESKWVNNESIVFVLMDKGVGSSGEEFIEQLRTVDNVVFVGSNTAGALGVSDQQRMYLPNSNLFVYLGVGLDLIKYPPHFIDSVGFKPDIWLNNEDMLERVINLCNRYNLK